MLSGDPHRTDNDVRVVVAGNQAEIIQALIVRSAAFLGEEGFSVGQIFDDNDAVATHLLMLAGDEPIGSARLRFFAGFVKAERTAFRKGYRNMRLLRTFIQFMFDHAARKGYPVLLTYAEERYAQLWRKMFGFELANDRPTYGVEGKERVLELIKRLEPRDDAVTLASDPFVHQRIEGRWHQPSVFETGLDERGR